MAAFSEQTVNECYEQYKAGKSFADIRKNLEEKGYDSQTVSDIIAFVDDKVIAGDVAQKSSYHSQLKKVGLVIMSLGGVIFIGSYFGLIPFFKGYYVIDYSSIIGGYLLFKISQRAERKAKGK